ncbi:MAG: hypothetical protein M1448_01735 [Candidatus Marsarchaeota archaeon]|nr:hypothetical protein [Candidatus Marsarchaeota archaeon]
MVNTCAILGGSTYVNSWVGINVLIVLIGFAAVSAAYMFSKLGSASLRTRMAELAKSEIAQLMVSLILIVVLIAFSKAACGISASVSQSLTGTQMNPFQFADSYLGELAFVKGLGLFSTIASKSLEYIVDSNIYAILPKILGNFLTSTGLTSCAAEPARLVTVSFNIFNFGCEPFANMFIMFEMLSYLYLELFAPVIISSVAVLFVQYLSIPFIQYLAFAVALPVAIALRAIPFGGPGLRSASNAILALAIAAYIIYPLTISFDAWAMNYIFSSSNPMFPYLHSTYLLNNAPPPSFLQEIPSNTISFFGTTTNSVESLVKSMFDSTSLINFIPFFNVPHTISDTELIANEIAQYVFQAVFLLALDVAITVGFAASLAKALNSGIGGGAALWSGL